MAHKKTGFLRKTCFFGVSTILLLAVHPIWAQQKPAMGGTITVAVSGFHDHDGILRVNLYKSADGFPADTSKAYQKRDIVLNLLAPNTPLSPLCVSFAGLPPGTYAVCSIHDSNSNNKLDTNFLGIPREDWAVSNDARPRFRSPHFDEAQFALGTGETKAVAFRVRHLNGLTNADSAFPDRPPRRTPSGAAS